MVERRRGPIEPGDGDPRHGTMNGYNTYGCRCDLCRQANTTYKQRNARKWNELDAPVLDPEVADIAAKFMAGDVETRSNFGRRYFYDGKKDAVSSDGQRMRSKRHRHGSGVQKKGTYRGTKP